MPKTRPSPGRCIHCLNHFELLTWDHVLPDSWYPDGSEELEKWKAPSCEKCNNDLSRVEQGLLTKLGLCIDPKELASMGIPDRVLRSLDPMAGHNERDREHRAKKRAKVLSTVKILDKLPNQGIFPNFGPDPSVVYPELVGIPISEEEVTKFGDKITRGITYIADQSFIEDTYSIKTIIIEEPNATEIKQMIEEGGVVFNRPPGLSVHRRLVENDKVGGFYRIEIWERFRLYVTVTPKDLEQRMLSV